MISPNSVTLYPAPHTYKEHFVYGGRRYFKTDARCLVSQYGRYGFLPSIDRGVYEKIPVGDYKKVKALYDLEKKKYHDQLNGNLNKGVKTQLTLSF